MGRKNQSIAEDLIGLTSKLPWWIGVVLAIFSYTLLHNYASQATATNTADFSVAIQGNALRMLATLGQYVLPTVFGIGALVSFINRLRRRTIHKGVSTGEKSISDIDWKDFEDLIHEHFRQAGFRVSDTGPGADGGVDLILKKDGATTLVQCKHWKVQKVGVKHVRELLGVMTSKGASAGIFVASGQYTHEAIKFAKVNGIELIDGEYLNKIWQASEAQNEPNSSRQRDETKNNEPPSCPKCGSDMVIRTAKKGQRAGGQFWGCSKFPSCKRTLSMH